MCTGYIFFNCYLSLDSTYILPHSTWVSSGANFADSIADTAFEMAYYESFTPANNPSSSLLWNGPFYPEYAPDGIIILLVVTLILTVQMVSCATPLYGNGSVFIGAVEVVLSLSQVSSIVENLASTPDGC